MSSPLVQYWNGALLTDWIDGSVKPSLPGVYQRDIRSFSLFGVSVFPVAAFALWDGIVWHVYGTSAEKAFATRQVSERQSLPWRGLARDPAPQEASIIYSNWIDGDQEPKLKGVYQRKVQHSVLGVLYALWDGVSWHCDRTTALAAHRDRALSFEQNRPWRGLRFRLGEPIGKALL
jgi:hypothetical protein